MKALKSPVAAEILADPVARNQLRQLFCSRLNTRAPARTPGSSDSFEIRQTDGRTIKATFVPKAKAV